MNELKYVTSVVSAIEGIPVEKEITAAYQAVTITRENGVIVSIEPAPDFPQTESGKIPKEVATQIQQDIAAFLDGSLDQLTTFCAIGTYVLGDFEGFLVAPGRTKTGQAETNVPAATIVDENAGHQLIRKPAHIPQTLDKVQNTFQPVLGNSIDYFHPRIEKALADVRGAMKIRFNDQDLWVVVVPNFSQIAMRVEISVIAWTDDIARMADQFNLRYDESNLIRWYANVSGQIKMAGICEKKGGPENFINPWELCSIQRCDVPDELRPHGQKAEPLIGLLEAILLRSCV